MLAEERLSRIMKLLSQQRTATVQELSLIHILGNPGAFRGMK